jgi:hypothetical protein
MSDPQNSLVLARCNEENMMSETRSSEYQRWLDAAAEYVRLEGEERQNQAELDVATEKWNKAQSQTRQKLDAVCTTLHECVKHAPYAEQALLLRDPLTLVVVTRREDIHSIHVKPVIG